MTVAEIQRALLARGYDLGPSGADNALGRLTIAAVTAFQKAEKLDILYPGTIGPKSIAALGLSATGPVVLPWIAEARRYLGLHERREPSSPLSRFVERFFAWISRNRRLWKDPEATLASAQAFLYAAAAMILVQRIGRPS